MNTRRRLIASMPLLLAGALSPHAPAGAQARPARPSSETGAAAVAPPPLGSLLELPPTMLLDGRELPAAYWRNKVLVVEMWASWCPFCQAQNPHLDGLHRFNRAAGLEVLALSIDKTADAARNYMKQHGYQFHAAMFDAPWQAAIGRPRGLPVLWVIGRDSRLKQLEIGELFPEDIDQLADRV